jgi:hypothetical protein
LGFILVGVYQVVLKEPVPLILEEAGSNNILLHQDGAHPSFGIEM